VTVSRSKLAPKCQYWIYVIWNPLEKLPEHVAIQNPAQKLDQAKHEIFASLNYEIQADAFNSLKSC
jgi:hypothetical protein